MTDADIDAEQADLEARLAAPGAVLNAALYYARLGLPVFPVNGKIPWPGTRGFHDACTSETFIRQWWAKWPAAGVAAPTGVLYDVVDIDGPPGYATMAGLAVKAGVSTIADLFPIILGKVKTLRGCHYLVPVTGRGNGAAVLGPGVDVRGVGGYTVLPPSKRDDAVAYRWTIPPTFGGQS